MSSAFVTLGAGFVFGLALAAPPGPMNALIAAESVSRGFTRGVWTGTGAMSADFLFFVLVWAGVGTVLVEYSVVQDGLFLVGGVLMLVFAWDAVSTARSGTQFIAEVPSGQLSGFQKAFVLSLTNPYQLAFWVTVGVSLVHPGTLELGAHLPGIIAPVFTGVEVVTGSAVLIAGFFSGIACWVLAFPGALVYADRHVNSFAPVIAVLSGMILGGFGVAFCWIGLQALLAGA